MVRLARRVVSLLVCVAMAGCFGEGPPGAGADDFGRCTAGMKGASRTSSRGDALQTYQRACSDLFESATCRQALKEAAGTVSDDWLSGSLAACARAYCPMISGDVKACKPGSVEGSDAIDQAWLELSHAVLKRTDERRAADIVLAFTRFFADLNVHVPPRRGTHAVPAAAVERCERGIERAVTLPSRREQRTAYYEECASLYETECRAAFTKASKADLLQQETIVLLGCRKTYCRWLSGSTVEACDGEFVPTHEAVTRAWPVLNRAILDLDAKENAPRLNRAMASLEGQTL